MLSNVKIKWIHSLEHKKYRQQYGLFVAEGDKIVGDLIKLISCRLLVATDDWLCSNPGIEAAEIISVDKTTLHKVSSQKSPQNALGIFEIPHFELTSEVLSGKLSLVLDNVQDPGNLGTIIRVADWFGIEHVICSIGTVDVYNSKTVQATMGAIGRVKIHYTGLEPFLRNINLPIYGTFLEGDNIYTSALAAEGLVVMGNEGNGISDPVADLVNRKLYIPDYPFGKTGSESLNVSVATAIICSEFRRRLYGKIA